MSSSCSSLDPANRTKATCQSLPQVDPQNAAALHVLGLIASENGDQQTAATLIVRAIAIDGPVPAYCVSLGFVLARDGKPDRAAACYRQALNGDASDAETWARLGDALLALRNVTDAETAYSRALTLAPLFVEARLGLARVQLLLGRYSEGWRGLEWRFRQKSRITREFDQQRWTGGPLPNQRLLVHTDQGLGDTLQLIRYVQRVKQKAGPDCTLVVACHESLAALLAATPFVDRIVALGTEIPSYDSQIPLLSLPFLFGDTLESIPREVPYVTPEPARVERWKGLIGGREKQGALRVGLAGSGGPDHPNDLIHFSDRGLDGEALSALSAPMPGIAFVFLDEDPVAENGTRQASGFADTAAILANLDLVISGDSAIAHLAGAMARPVWTLLPFAADWRWLLDREDSPWYPTMRLFRQSHRGDWSGVIARVRAELRRIAARAK